MTDAQRTKRVERAQIRVLFNVPFFAAGVARLPVVFTDDAAIPTACTDGEEIRWNREWFDTLDDSILPTILCHEACHCLLGHLWREPAGADHDVWNQAADHAVNLMLKDFSGQRDMRLADPFPFPVDKPPLADPRYKGWSEEAIFADLMRNPPKGQGQGQQPAAGGVGSTGAGQPAPGTGKPGQSGGKPSKSPISNPSAFGGPSQFGQFSKPKKDAAAQKQDKADWDGTLINSIKAAKGRGDVPGSLDRFVDALINPQVPWPELLRNFLREQTNEDFDFMRPNRLYDEGDFILPSLNSERMGAVVFAKDWSGSVDQALATVFESEQQNCLDDMKPSKLVDMIFDTAIRSEKDYRLGDKIESKAQAGGGTDFRCIFKRCDEMATPPKCLVVLTDLQGTFPEVHPEFPTLWVVYGSESKAPFGDVIKVK